MESWQVGAQQVMNERPRQDLIRHAGWVLITAGLFWNEWIVGLFFSEDHAIQYGAWLVLIRAWNLGAVGAGLVAVTCACRVAQWVGEHRLRTIAAIAWCFALTCTLLFLGAALVGRFAEPVDSAVNANFSVALTGGMVLLASGTYLLRREAKSWAFLTLACLLILLAASGVGELVARRFAPSWPASGLHGVAGEKLAQAWSQTAAQHGGVGLNSWGQRDQERALEPKPGVCRVAFIGDSFLEESESVPVSVAVQTALGSSDVEVLNLGVSATGPAEYYYRAKNIGGRLRMNHCCIFFYAGNDFAALSKPWSLSDVVAVYPRESLFSCAGMPAMNHYLTNSRRAFTQTWGAAGRLGEGERHAWEKIRQASREDIVAVLTSVYSLRKPQADHLSACLSQAGGDAFVSMLRNPDCGRFRSYLLQAAMGSVTQPAGSSAAVPVDPAYEWVSRTFVFCRERGIGFTLVIVPEAFQVDDRMRDQWMPLTDMRKLTMPMARAAAALAARARADGMDVLDLSKALAGQNGTYLNLDGHWSEKGVSIVTPVVTEHLRGILQATGQGAGSLSESEARPTLAERQP